MWKRKPDQCDKILRAKLSLKIKIFSILKILLGVDGLPYRNNVFLVNKSQLTVRYWLNLVTLEPCVVNGIVYLRYIDIPYRHGDSIVDRTFWNLIGFDRSWVPCWGWSICDWGNFWYKDSIFVSLICFHQRNAADLYSQFKYKYQLFPLSAIDFFRFQFWEFVFSYIKTTSISK